jgi:hypothetical protein
MIEVGKKGEITSGTNEPREVESAKEPHPVDTFSPFLNSAV